MAVAGRVLAYRQVISCLIKETVYEPDKTRAARVAARAPVLFGQIKGKLLTGDSTVALDDKSYSVIKDNDERGDFYVLTPED